MRACDFDCSSEDAVAVEAALARLAALPVVKFVFPINGARPGVQAQLLCSCAHRDPRAAKEQAQTTSTRNILGCFERCEQLIRERHSNEECLSAARAAAAVAAAEVAATAGPSTPATAFEAMAAARHVQPAQERAAQAERRATEARAAQKAAEDALEAANKAVEIAESEADRLEEEVHHCGSNRQRIVLWHPLSFLRAVFACASACPSPTPSRVRFFRVCTHY